MYRFQILLNPAILSADKHRLPTPNLVIFLSGKDVFLTLSLAWSRCVVISNLSHLVCQAAQHANPWKHMSEKVWRGFSGDVWNRDIQLCPVTGDCGRSQERHFRLCYMFIWQLFRSFSGFEEADMSYLLILGLTVLWIIQIQVSCMKTCCLCL